MRYLGIVVGLVMALLTPIQSAGGKEKSEVISKKANRLLTAASPYLRQHGYNPVDWHMWGDEAFARARKENKPIFLSVGYSTCHWCHVMERESFENEAIAKILNKYFVAIKVDRERRPDVDETYMIATQIITRRGGWPNSLFLTPDLKPFYAGTYFPPDTFSKLLEEIGQQWSKNEPELRADGDRVSEVIEQVLNRRVAAQRVTPKALVKAGKDILREADPFNGGFDTAPKFPNEPTLMFLLQLAAKHKNEEALKAVTRTIDAMLDGGIHDHVGGGFHRYAVDNGWRVPHFEKMLYNQAQMVRVLLLAYRLTGSERYAAAARRVITYVERHMTSPEGGFYSAWDADSEGKEGTFYVWTPQQFEEVLGKEDAAIAAKIFGVTPAGNFEGHTILHFRSPPLELASSLSMNLDQFNDKADRFRKKLYAAREKRIPPHLDEKVVLSWNGMMIAAISEAALVLGDSRYIEMAEKALLFIERKMKDQNGDFKRSYYMKKAELDAQQEDYAFLALAYILTFDATRNREYLQKARELSQAMTARFVDDKNGDFFMAAKTDTFTRGKNRSDGAMPSGNSTALEVFAMLSRRDQDPEHRNRGEQLLAALSGLAFQSPRSGANVLRSADMMLGGEVGPMQYLAKGVVRASAQLEKGGRKATISLEIAPGWHINAHKPLSDDYIPTKVNLETPNAGKRKIDYPSAIERKLNFSEGKMALYENRAQIDVELFEQDQGKLDFRLSLQACSDKICLEPVEAVLFVRKAMAGDNRKMR